MEIFNRQRAREICDLGITEKRNENYSKAIEYYDRAKSFDPTFSSIYNNSAKIFIGIGDYESAFKNLLTYAHLNLISPQYNISQYELLLPEYEWDNPITNSIQLKKNLVVSVCNENAKLKYIAVELNLCAKAGVCYAFRNKSVMEYNKIDMSLFTNNQNSLLGKFPNGKIIGDSVYSNLMNILGFSYLIRNIKGGNYTEVEISQLYLNDSFASKDIT